MGDDITNWAVTAKALLGEGGNIMHSSWIVGSDVLAQDLVRSGWITEDEASSIDPDVGVPVYSRRIRSEDPPVKRTVEDLSAFAESLREHMVGYPAMWFAAGIVVGLWPLP